MDARPDGALVVGSPLSMSQPARDELSAEAAEVARLVSLTLGGDGAAFEQVIIRYQARVLTVAARILGRRDEAQDVAQEVFLRAFKYLHRLDVSKPIEPWLVRITVNVCRDLARTQHRHRHTFVQIDPPEAVDDAADPYAGVVQAQERHALRKALDSLPEKERLAIVLRDIDGLSTADVAAILQSSETTVRSQVSRGRLRLKAAIDRLLGGDP